VKLFLALLLIPQVAFAGCLNAIRLEVGDKVTDCPRIGLSIEYDEKVRQDLIKGEFNAKIVDHYEGLLKVKDQVIESKDKQITIYRAEVDRSHEALDKERSRSKVDFWIGLGTGAAVILLGAIVVQKVVR
jgi:hypothetical protein